MRRQSAWLMSFAMWLAPHIESLTIPVSVFCDPDVWPCNVAAPSNVTTPKNELTLTEYLLFIVFLLFVDLNCQLNFHQRTLPCSKPHLCSIGCKVPRRNARSFIKAKNTGTRINT